MGRGSSKVGGSETSSVPSGKMRINGKEDIDSFYDAPKGTVFTLKDNYGQYIGEYTKGDGNKWVASQKKASYYPAPKSASTKGKLYSEIQNMDVVFKKKG